MLHVSDDELNAMNDDQLLELGKETSEDDYPELVNRISDDSFVILFREIALKHTDDAAAKLLYFYYQKAPEKAVEALLGS